MTSPDRVKELEKRIAKLEAECARHAHLEADLKRSIRFAESLLEAIPTPVFFKDAQGRYQGCNTAFTEIMGISAQKLRGKTVEELWPSEHARTYHQKDLELMENPTRQQYEFEVMDKEGTTRPVIFSKNVFRDENGKVAGLVGGFIDISERKRAEEALQESEEKYRSLTNNLNVGLYRNTVGTRGKFIEANPALLKMFGFDSKADFLNINVSDLYLNPDDRKNYIEKMIQEGGVIDEELPLRKKDGTSFIGSISAVVVKDENGEAKYFDGIVEDITERKRVEGSLRESEEDYRNLYQNAQVGLARTRISDGKVLSCNEKMARIFKFDSVDAFLDGYVFSKQYVDPGVRERILKRVMENGVINNVEAEFYGKDGSTVWARFDTRIFPDKGYMEDVVLDVTERRLAEEALRQSEVKYRSMMESMIDPIYICSHDFRIEYMNPAMIQRIGRDATGETCYRVLHGQEEGCKWCAFDEIYKGRTTETTIVSPLDQRHYRVTNMPVPNEDGSVSKMTIYRDITDYLAAVSEKEKARAQLLQSQKMEAIGTLAGGIAHDFNNMLGAIMGRAEMVLLDMKPGDRHRLELEEILRTTTRSADLTKQLLTFARKQAISPKILALNDTVEASLKMLRRLIGEHIDLAWHPDTDLWLVKVDAAQLDQVLTNLCVNARDAISGTGKISIETKNVIIDDADRAVHSEMVPGEYVMLVVTDNGCGMDKEVLENAFEPFYTTKKIGEGTGLGLSTVYGIVRQNDGFIDVYSEAGKGTTFQIYFPKIDVALKAEEKPVPNKLATGTETVLVVEDEESILSISQTVLERHGYKVLPAGTPMQALEVIGNHREPVHLLITDVVMPEMNGKELKERIEALTPNIKVLFMSGYTSDVILHRGVLEGDVHFLQKPFSIETLVTKVREVLDEDSPTEHISS